MSEMLKIGKICNITTGKLDSNQFVAGGKYPFFTCAANPLEIDTFAFDDDAILVAGNNASGTFHLNRYKGKFNAYQRTYVLTTKPNYHLDYIFYSLKLELKRLKEKSQGSQTKFLTMPILKNIGIKKLDYSIQQKITAVLSALDAKIELNQRINAELEAMAKTLYDYWFVQFDFPNEQGQPYKSSGGKIVWNVKLGKDIPEGWQVKPLGKALKTNLGGTPSTKNLEYWENATIPWLNSGDLSDFPIISSSAFVTKKGVDNSATTVLPKGSVVISLVRYIRPSIIAIEACANQSVVGILESEELKNTFIYSYLVNEVPRLMKLRTGAQQPHINKEIIDESWLCIPPKEILGKYYKISEPIYKKFINTAFESQTLMELRDWLLPMLMNGQVKVN
jgi:type I restriction enzyme S subunit